MSWVPQAPMTLSPQPSYHQRPPQQQQQWAPRPRPPPPTLAAPIVSGHGCCADRCPDPTMPCCDDVFGIDADDCMEFPIDGAGCATVLLALGFTAGCIVLGVLGTPNIASLSSSSDIQAVQVSLCANVKFPSWSNGCATTATTNTATPACANVGSIFSGVGVVRLCEDSAFHAGLLAAELAYFDATLTLLFAACAVVSLALVALVCGRRCCTPNLPPTLAEEKSQHPSPPPPPPTMTNSNPPQPWRRPLRAAEPTLPFASDPTFAAAVRVWPGVALVVDLLLVPSVLSFAATMPVLLSGSTGALHSLLQSFWVKYTVAVTVGVVLVSLPLIKHVALLFAWTVGGVPWLLYRYAGDTRVMHRVVKNSRIVDEPCEAPCCIMIDMVCCSCLDSFAPVAPPPTADTAAPPTAAASEKTPDPKTSRGGDGAAEIKDKDPASAEPPTRLSSPSADDKTATVTAPTVKTGDDVTTAAAALLVKALSSRSLSKESRKSRHRSTSVVGVGAAAGNDDDDVKKEKKEKRSRSKRKAATAESLDIDALKTVTSIDVKPLAAGVAGDLNSPVELASTAAPSLRSSLNVDDAADAKALRRLLRKSSKTHREAAAKAADNTPTDVAVAVEAL